MPFFANLSEDEMKMVESKISTNLKGYSRGDLIFSPESNEQGIGIVASGECEVLRGCSSDTKVILNTLYAYDCFGILSVFNKDPFPTFVYAKKKCQICFIDAQAITELVSKSSTIALNIIKFLAQRASYLNSKLETVTKASVESRLSSYILKQSKINSSDTFTINLKRCSESINAGRTSVYRSLRDLISAGYIEAEGNKIKIININKLKEYAK